MTNCPTCGTPTPGGGDVNDFPPTFHQWPRKVQAQWVEAYHALYFPKLHPWEKPDYPTSQLPPDHPRHTD